jgi:hypothetical protein
MSLEIPKGKTPVLKGGKHNSGKGCRALAGFSYGGIGKETFDVPGSRRGGK